MAKKKRKTPPRYKSGPKKGQFMPKRAVAAKKAAKKKSKPKKAKQPKALVKRGKSQSMAKKKSRKKRRNNPRSGGLGDVKDLMIGGTIYGFVSQTTPEADSISAKVQEQIEKVPELGNKDITAGLVFYAIDRYIWPNKWLRSTSRAALTVGAVEFGRAGFSLEGEGVSGELDDDYSDAVDVTDEGSAMSGIVD